MGVQAHAGLHLDPQVHAELALEEDGVVHIGNGRAAVRQRSGAHDIHDLGLVVLVQVGQDLGTAGPAAGGLQVTVPEQVRPLHLDLLVQEGVQDTLLRDKGPHGGVGQKPRPVIRVLDDLGQGWIGPLTCLVLPALGVVASTKTDGSESPLEQLGLQVPGHRAVVGKGEMANRGHEVRLVFQETQRGHEHFWQRIHRLVD